MRQERTKKLRILSERKKRAFYESQLGQTREALLEADNHDGYLHGFTYNYLKVKVPYDEALINTLQTVEITGIDTDGVCEVGVLVGV